MERIILNLQIRNLRRKKSGGGREGGKNCGGREGGGGKIDLRGVISSVSGHSIPVVIRPIVSAAL